MKKLLIGLLVLGSLSSFADCIEIVQKMDTTLRGNALEVDVKNSHIIPDLMKMTSRIVCGSNFGNYLYVDTGANRISYKIRYRDQCQAIVSAMGNNPYKIYKVETHNNVVLKVSRDQICVEERIILNL